MGLLRNRAFCRELALMAGVLAAAAALAYAVEGGSAGAWALGTGALSCALFWAFSAPRRHREIARLAEEVDEVLHGGRRIDFSDYREGDLAVLKNELAKMTAALAGANERLGREKSRSPTRWQTCPIDTHAAHGHRADRRSHRGGARRRRALSRPARTGGPCRACGLARDGAPQAGEGRRRCHPRASVGRRRAAAAVREALAPLEGALDLRGVAVETRVEPGATFTGDAAWSAEALGNVLKNCMEHTPSGGVVCVRASEDAVAFRIS